MGELPIKKRKIRIERVRSMLGEESRWPAEEKRHLLYRQQHQTQNPQSLAEQLLPRQQKGTLLLNEEILRTHEGRSLHQNTNHLSHHSRHPRPLILAFSAVVLTAELKTQKRQRVPQYLDHQTRRVHQSRQRHHGLFYSGLNKKPAKIQVKELQRH